MLEAKCPKPVSRSWNQGVGRAILPLETPGKNPFLASSASGGCTIPKSASGQNAGQLLVHQISLLLSIVVFINLILSFVILFFSLRIACLWFWILSLFLGILWEGFEAYTESSLFQKRFRFASPRCLRAPSIRGHCEWPLRLRFFRTNGKGQQWHKTCMGSSCGKEFPWETHPPSTTTEAEARLFPGRNPLWQTSWVTLCQECFPFCWLPPFLQTVALPRAPTHSPLALKRSSLPEINRHPPPPGLPSASVLHEMLSYFLLWRIFFSLSFLLPFLSSINFSISGISSCYLVFNIARNSCCHLSTQMGP